MTISIRALSCLMLALPLACSQEAYDAPGPHTEPSVSLNYPKFYRDQNPAPKPVSFGEASADLPVTIVGVEDNGRDHVIDLGLPKEAVMYGYGAYEGMTERYNRTRLRDSNGIHGVRLAVYRTDSNRGHTNVWTHFLARAENADIFLTEQGQWDWIGGEEDTSGFSRAAWPFFAELQRSYYPVDGFFGFSPGIYSRTEHIRQVIFSTTATSPTYRIQNCVQVLFNAFDPALRHQAFLHERYGLVEVVYRWHDLDSAVSSEAPLVPLDGFAAEPSTLEEIPEPPTTQNDLAGTWRGRVELEDSDGRTSTREVKLELEPTGLAYRELSDSYDVQGTYSDGDIETRVRGRYYRPTNLVRLVQGRNVDSLYFEAEFSRASGANGHLAFGLHRYLVESDRESQGGGELERVSTR